MPELPEVHTTATILNKLIRNKKICDVWTDYNSPYYAGKENIKNPIYFKKFKSKILGKKIIKVWRRAKNVLIDLEGNSSILVHMKMTGHLLVGDFVFDKKNKKWKAKNPGPLQDPYNRFIHFVITFSDGTHLAFCDTRKFGTITLLGNKDSLKNKIDSFGPEPLEKNFTWENLKTQLLKKPKEKIKTALLNQEAVAGIGNIYSDEILWASFIHPERTVLSITNSEYKILIKNTKEILTKGIDFGGDSMSDYRNPFGLKGEFQLHHQVYRRKGQICKKQKCKQIIERKVIGGRSSHFCSNCQK